MHLTQAEASEAVRVAQKYGVIKQDRIGYTLTKQFIKNFVEAYNAVKKSKTPDLVDNAIILAIMKTADKGIHQQHVVSTAFLVYAVIEEYGLKLFGLS